MWLVPVLWEAARVLTPYTLDVRTLEETRDRNSWLVYLNGPPPRDWWVDREMPRILAAELIYPVILHPHGWLMDGYHRVGKVILAGGHSIQAVKFTWETLPPPFRVY